MGTGNILSMTHLQEINSVLAEVETCIAKSKIPEETKSVNTTIIHKIRNFTEYKNIQAINNELGNLYNLIKNITPCISVAVSITGLLSTLNS